MYLSLQSPIEGVTDEEWRRLRDAEHRALEYLHEQRERGRLDLSFSLSRIYDARRGNRGEPWKPAKVQSTLDIAEIYRRRNERS